MEGLFYQRIIKTGARRNLEGTARYPLFRRLHRLDVLHPSDRPPCRTTARTLPAFPPGQGLDRIPCTRTPSRAQDNRCELTDSDRIFPADVLNVARESAITQHWSSSSRPSPRAGMVAEFADRLDHFSRLPREGATRGVAHRNSDAPTWRCWGARCGTV